MGAFLVVNAVEASLDWNNYLFGSALQVVWDILRALWTILSALLSLCAALITLCLNAAVVFVTLVPQVHYM